MLASISMTRALALLILSLAACGGTTAGKIMADTPVLPYQAPDISEITGIEEPDEADAEQKPAPAPAPPAAQPKK
jgi:hypothetical protein